MRVCMLVCACACARGRGQVCTVCEKRGKKKGNLLCLPSTFFAPVPLFTLPVFSSTLPCLLAVRCPSNRLRQQAVAAAAAAYTRVLYIRPSYSAFFFPSFLPFSIHRSWHSQISCGESSSHLKCMKERPKRTSGASPPKTTSLHCPFFFFPQFFFLLPIPNYVSNPQLLSTHTSTCIHGVCVVHHVNFCDPTVRLCCTNWRQWSRNGLRRLFWARCATMTITILSRHIPKRTGTTLAGIEQLEPHCMHPH